MNPISAASATPEHDDAEIRRVAHLLGGPELLGGEVTTRLAAHELLARGLPGRALHHLIGSLSTLDPKTSLEEAVGLSLRTLQRSKGNPMRPLSVDQSGRTWKFAEILAEATEVLGSQEEAERWLTQPAVGFDGRRPIDLLSTPAGVEIVETFLKRLEHGVYA